MTATASEQAEDLHRSVKDSAFFRVLLGLVTMAGALVMLGVTAAPAQAAFNPDARTGYTKVVEKEAYLSNLAAAGFQILHVDTEHAAVDGFWFAAKSGVSARGFDWKFQPYGMWCGDTTLQVEWNGWMNTTRCGYNFAKAEAEFPGITERTNVCRTTTGHPWKTGSPFADNTGCSNGLLNPIGSGTYQEPVSNQTCAPWEEQGLTPAGSPKCLKQRYAWETATPNAFWLPAPDTCTGLPEHANRGVVYPDAYVPAGPVPDCTGEALAPNCPVDSTHQACTGIPPKPVVSASVTKTVTVATGTASASVTKTKSGKVVVRQVKKTAKAKHKGKVYKVSRTGKIVVKFTRSATADATVTTGTATRTVTSSCAAETQDAAQACADAKAAAEATTQAQVAANADAKDKARAAAASQASIDVSVVFRDAVSSYKVTRAAKKALAKKTMKRAKRALAKKIAKVS